MAALINDVRRQNEADRRMAFDMAVERDKTFAMCDLAESGIF